MKWDDPPLVAAAKGKRKVIIKQYSSSEEASSDKEVEATCQRKLVKSIKRVQFIPNPYMSRPHTRPKNKMRLKYKLIANPELKDLIINEDEGPKNKAKEKKAQKRRQPERKKPNKKVDKAKALRLLSSILDSLSWRS